ncbi:rabenosyn-5-like [Saccoglossus kowalevskii]|uniref:Rabenosyn-5-like n=1 Tax=Saccoglossus kowalevskii TaxID=10224 RepID=A0ABM0MVT2_SACKO|nr:PREDICTED: rabenosyn-5-like [Saccoglossus kowalevskii]
MADSLNLGETAYNLDMATDVRMKLLKMYEIMDIISKKILVLGMSGENRATQTEQRLQRMIRQYVTSYLQDNMVTLQALPSRDQYERLKLEREAAIARRLEKQKQAAIEAQRQEDERRENEKRKQERFSFMTHQLSTSPSHSRDGVSTERSVAKESVGKEGWEPTQLPVAASASDPMLLQMDIIRNYIQQARNAQKLDEVKMLESNLHELQSEYWKQKQSNVQNKINQL